MGELHEHAQTLASFHSLAGSYLVLARAAACRVTLALGREGSRRHSMTEFSPWATAGVLPHTQSM